MTPSFDIQYLRDKNGNKTAVIIPIKDWIKFTEKLEKISEYKALSTQMNAAFSDILDMKKNRKEKISLIDFLENN